VVVTELQFTVADSDALQV